MNIYLPILLILLANIIYNLCTKLMPSGTNPFLSLVVTYLCAAALTALLYVTVPYSGTRTLSEDLHSLNWTGFALGFAIVGLEFGYILAYRMGWNISVCSATTNIMLALVLVPIGILFFKDNFTLTKAIGMILCIAGLFLLNKK